MKIGIDVDGVLADFNSTFIERVIKITGRDLFPARPFDIPMWSYPEHYGYTRQEMDTVWGDIKLDPWFWRDLKPYPHTQATLEYLAGRQLLGDDVYYITARPGVVAKRQTEQWIEKQYRHAFLVPNPPTVLISSEKGLCAKALELDFYVDDRNRNVDQVANEAPDCSAWIFDQPWNKRYNDEYRTRSVIAAIEESIRVRECKTKEAA